MYLGKLVELGTGDDIYHSPAHPYTDGADQDNPGARSRGRKQQKGRTSRSGGEPPSPDPPSVRLPVPHPLPAGAGHVRGGRATAAELRPRPSGGLPLPVRRAADENGSHAALSSATSDERSKMKLSTPAPAADPCWSRR